MSINFFYRSNIAKKIKLLASGFQSEESNEPTFGLKRLLLGIYCAQKFGNAFQSYIILFEFYQKSHKWSYRCIKNLSIDNRQGVRKDHQQTLKCLRVHFKQTFLFRHHPLSITPVHWHKNSACRKCFFISACFEFEYRYLFIFVVVVAVSTLFS